MDTGILVLIIFVLVAIAVFSFFRILHENRQIVSPTDWVILKNGLTGELDARSPGTHLLPPEWLELMRLSTRMKPVKVENQRVRSMDGRYFIVSYRFNTVFGRNSRPIPGVPLAPNGKRWWEFVNPAAVYDPSSVTREAMIAAATLVEEGKLEERISQALETALEESVGHLSDGVLLSPSEQAQLAQLAQPPLPLPLVPDTLNIPGVQQDPVASTGELQRKLAEWIQRVVHRELLPLGLGVADFTVTDPPRYADQRMHEAFEDKRRKKLIGEAANELMDELQRQGRLGDYSGREAVAAGTPAEGQVAVAQAERDKAKYYKEAAQALASVRDLIKVTNIVGGGDQQRGGGRQRRP